MATQSRQFAGNNAPNIHSQNAEFERLYDSFTQLNTDSDVIRANTLAYVRAVADQAYYLGDFRAGVTNVFFNRTYWGLGNAGFTVQGDDLNYTAPNGTVFNQAFANTPGFFATSGIFAPARSGGYILVSDSEGGETRWTSAALLLKRLLNSLTANPTAGATDTVQNAYFIRAITNGLSSINRGGSIANITNSPESLQLGRQIAPTVGLPTLRINDTSGADTGIYAVRYNGITYEWSLISRAGGSFNLDSDLRTTPAAVWESQANGGWVDSLPTLFSNAAAPSAATRTTPNINVTKTGARGTNYAVTLTAYPYASQVLSTTPAPGYIPVNGTVALGTVDSELTRIYSNLRTVRLVDSDITWARIPNVIANRNFYNVSETRIIDSDWLGVVQGENGGTGVNNGRNKITVSRNFTTTGAFDMTLNAQAATNVSLPITGTGTLATLDNVETFTNKTLTSPTITNGNYNAANGTFVFPQSVSASPTTEGQVVWDTDSDVLRIGTGSDTKTLLDTNSTQTITNKTFNGTANVINDATVNLDNGSLILPFGLGASVEGQIQWDADSDLLRVGDGVGFKTLLDTNSDQTLTNKSFFGPANRIIDASVSLTNGAFVFPQDASAAPTNEAQAIWDTDSDVLRIGTGGATKTLVNTDNTQTLTNKTLTSPIITNGDYNAANGTFVFPQNASAAPTTEGQVIWDTDSDVLRIGTGGATKTLVNTDNTQTLTNKTLDGTANTIRSANIDLNANGTGSLVLPFGTGSSTEGRIQWNQSTDEITVGTSSGAKTIVNTDNAQTITNKTFNGTANVINDATVNLDGGSLILPLGAGSNTEGLIAWDSANDLLRVGTGTGQKTMVDTNSTQTLSNKTFTGTTLTGPTINNGTTDLTGGTLILPQSTTAAPTTEGSISWDTDDDLLRVGTGGSTKTMVDLDSTQTLTNKTLTTPTINSITTTSGTVNTNRNGTMAVTSDIGNGTLTLGVSGTGLSGTASFTANQSGNTTFTVTSNATSGNTGNAIVARDASGNFSAGTITAALSGNATTATTTTGNAATATVLQTTRTINGTSFNGSANITTATWGTARTINGVSINGSADAILDPLIDQDLSSNATRYLTFVDSSSAGYQRLNVDNSIGYNPSTNTLSLVNIVSTGNVAIDATGNITATGDVTAFSDERLKANWKGLPADAIERMAEVRRGTYDRIDTGARQLGVSAQGMRKFLPESTTSDSDGFLAVAYGQAALAMVGELCEEVVNLRAEIKALKQRGSLWQRLRSYILGR